MKRLLKKLAFVVAIVMVVTTVVPSLMPSITAASKITLKSGAAAPSTVYTGHTYTLKVAGTAVKFYSSNKAVATIGATTGKLKAVAPGIVKITAKSKKTGKTVASKTFSVKQRATSVTTDVSELTLNVKETATIKATLSPATSTDVVRFYSENKEVVRVGLTSGKVTAVAEGSAVIKVYAKATKATSNSSKYNKVAEVTVNVVPIGPKLESLTQVSEAVLILSFNKDMTDVNLQASDFDLVCNDTNTSVGISSVVTTGKTVRLATSTALQAEQSYTLTYGKDQLQFTTEKAPEPSETPQPSETPVPTSEAPAVTSEAPAVTSEAPAVTSEAPVPTTEAPAVTSEAPAPTEAPATSEAPAVTSEAPAATSEAPAATSEAPAATSEAPAATSEAPAATSEAPVATSEAPAATSEAPAATPGNGAPGNEAISGGIYLSSTMGYVFSGRK
jgi:hypothetical protein